MSNNKNILQIGVSALDSKFNKSVSGHIRHLSNNYPWSTLLGQGVGDKPECERLLANDAEAAVHSRVVEAPRPRFFHRCRQLGL
jgi:hypothetical protein